MRVLVLEPSARNDVASLDQGLDDSLVGVALVALVGEHALAGEARGLLGEPTVGVDCIGDRRVDAARRERPRIRGPHIKVLTAVARRGVHKAGAGVVADVIASQHGDCEAVAAALDKARKEPNNFDAQLKAAELYYQIQRYDDSIGYLLKANQLQPDSYETVANLGMVNMDAGHFETAEKWYKAALLKRPEDIRVLDGLCNVFLEQGKAKESEDAIAKLAKADPKHGEQVAKVCLQCHTFAKGEPNKIGPNLFGVMAENIAGVPNYQFSQALSAHKGEKWDPDKLNVWLAKPQEFAKGTKMTFPGLPKGQDRADVIAYLESLK